jgi:hypothetical protein
MLRFVFSLLILVSAGAAAQTDEPADHVNPFIGTDFFGHTFPGASVMQSEARYSEK